MRKIYTFLTIVISINLYCQNNEFIDKNKTIYIKYPKNWYKNEEIGEESKTNVIVAFIEPKEKSNISANFTITVSKIKSDEFDKNELIETERQFKEYLINYKLLKSEKLNIANSKAMVREYHYSTTKDAQKTFTKQIEIRKKNYSYILSFNCLLDLLPKYQETINEFYNSFEFLNFESKNCKELSKGTFYYNIENTNSYIENTDSSQTEIDQNENFKIVSKKEWISDCEYNLTVSESSDEKNIPIGSVLNIKILNVTDRSYTYIWDTNYSRGKNELYKK
jgi:hypothetical protein